MPYEPRCGADALVRLAKGRVVRCDPFLLHFLRVFSLRTPQVVGILPMWNREKHSTEWVTPRPPPGRGAADKSGSRTTTIPRRSSTIPCAPGRGGRDSSSPSKFRPVRPAAPARAGSRRRRAAPGSRPGAGRACRPAGSRPPSTGRTAAAPARRAAGQAGRRCPDAPAWAFRSPDEDGAGLGPSSAATVADRWAPSRTSSASSPNASPGHARRAARLSRGRRDPDPRTGR